MATSVVERISRRLGSGSGGDPTGPRRDFGQLLRILLALLSAGAAVIHFSVSGGHFGVSWMHGLFFVVIGWAQALWAVLILVRPSRLILLGGIGGNALVIATWIVSRTVGVPIGPTAGLPEVAAFEDVLATVFEALIVAGSIVLLRSAVRRRSLSSRAFAAGALLPVPAVVLLTSMALAFAAGGGGHHQMPGGGLMTGHAHAEGTTAVGHHAATSIPESDPILVELKAVAEEDGTMAALDRLEEIIAQDGGVQSLAHQYVHALGRFVYATYGTARGFSSCDQRFESGCYHGVLQGYFEDNPNFTGQDVAQLCRGPVQAGGTTFLHFQCLHGLGHGLTLFYNHNLVRPLRYCDFLAPGWERQSCYGGVFMENIIYAMSPLGQGPNAEGEGFLEEDPHYPCSSVGEQYKTDCYLMQSSVILYLNGHDFEDGFRECENAPEAYISICYESMGRDIAGFARHDPVQSTQLCQQGNPAYRGHCFLGATKTLINVEGTTDPGIAFCAGAPPDSKPMCYQGIGQMVASLFNEVSQRQAECAKAGVARWIALCSQAAGVPAGTPA